MRDEYEITTSIQILVDGGMNVYPAEVVDWDMNVTVPCDLLQCNLRLLRHMKQAYLIGSNVRADSKLTVNNAVIGQNVTIEHPISITNSLVMPNTNISSPRDLDSVIVSQDNTIQCNPVHLAIH